MVNSTDVTNLIIKRIAYYPDAGVIVKTTKIQKKKKEEIRSKKKKEKKIQHNCNNNNKIVIHSTLKVIEHNGMWAVHHCAQRAEFNALAAVVSNEAEERF